MKTLKTPANEKRAKLPRAVDYSKDFLLDWKRLSASGRFNLKKLKQVMLLLIENEGPLPEQYKNHPLQGDKSQYFDCHISSDFVLLYSLDSKSSHELVVFARTGTHSELLD